MGALLQCGGVMTIAISLDLLQAGIFTTRTHALMTLVGLVTTLIAGPLLARSGVRAPGRAPMPAARPQRFVKKRTSATIASAKSSGWTITPPAMAMMSRMIATMSSTASPSVTGDARRAPAGRTYPPARGATRRLL